MTRSMTSILLPVYLEVSVWNGRLPRPPFQFLVSSFTRSIIIYYFLLSSFFPLCLQSTSTFKNISDLSSPTSLLIMILFLLFLNSLSQHVYEPSSLKVRVSYCLRFGVLSSSTNSSSYQ